MPRPKQTRERGRSPALRAVLLAGLSACSSSDRPASDGGLIRLDTVGSVTLANAAYPLFGVTGALLFDDGIVVANGQVQQLLFYDLSGRFRRAVGRRGRGPGEFDRLGWLQRVGDHLWVNDDMLQRVSEFNADGDFLRSVNIAPVTGYLGAQAVGVFPDGTLLVKSWSKISAATEAPIRYRDTAQLLRYDREGRYLESVGIYFGPETYAERWGRGGQIYLELPLGKKSVVVVEGAYYYITNDAASGILVHDAAGAIVRKVPSNGLRASGPFSQNELARVRRRVADRFPKNMNVGGIAERVPVEPVPPPLGWAGDRPLSMFRIDRDGNVWALEFGGVRADPPVWTVIGADGSIMGRVTAEEELDVLDSDGPVVLVHRWDRNDTETVEVRRIRW